MTTSPLRILIVDDNADAAGMLRMLLKIQGHNARMEFDGPAAIAAAADFKPDVVLLDLTLPGMSGVEVAEALRRLPELRGCRIAAVTGHGEERLPSPSPFDHHLQKPVRHDDLSAFLDASQTGRAQSLMAAVA
jgi:two-component system, sensor histidine kinase